MAVPDVDELLAADREHVWHPYGADARGAARRCPWSSARGRAPAAGRRARARRRHGLVVVRRSTATATRALDAAVRAQLDRMAHVMFGGLTHEPAVALADAAWSTSRRTALQHVFFADSGSVAVEVAIKMACSTGASPGARRSTRLLALRGGYHGDTFGAMARVRPGRRDAPACSPTSCRASCSPTRPPGGFDAPVDAGWRDGVEALLERARRRAGRGRSPSRSCRAPAGCTSTRPAYVRALRELCDAHDVLLVLDEIATGFGRTGRAVRLRARGRRARRDVRRQGAHRRLHDAGGHALHRARWPRASRSGEAGVLMHGPTFMANPLACAVALRLDRPAGDRRLARRRAPRRGRPARRARAGARSCPASPTCACWARSASSSSTARSTWRAATAAAVDARRVAAARSATSSTPCRRTSRRRRARAGRRGGGLRAAAG